MEKRIFKVSVTVYKKDDMRYFSQLDLTKIFERALRRAKLPLYFTQGFNSRPKMSFSKALKLGCEGEEKVILYFIERVDEKL
ncbi:MAG: TIGR03936 family radical SAM-associated protein, partial [Candidatus Omnitrophica bacterium]|nr:TIGR03936 family radical SAM-associated protein [Candidatus Omnitrophota bacterium]